MKYKCLILDHDDTGVKSTPNIHSPSFVRTIKELQPFEVPPSFEEFVKYCFNPGFSKLCTDIIQFTDYEQRHQQKVWKIYTEETIPEFYELFMETVQRFKGSNGIAAVVSHFESKKIVMDYLAHCGFKPGGVFGWELPEAQRKPNPYPVQQILIRFNLAKEVVLVVDDLGSDLECPAMWCRIRICWMVSYHTGN